MKDFLGKELAIGDNVVFVRPNYRDFYIGEILKFTPQNVRVSCKDTWDGTFLQHPSQLIKIEQ